MLRQLKPTPTNQGGFALAAAANQIDLFRSKLGAVESFVCKVIPLTSLVREAVQQHIVGVASEKNTTTEVFDWKKN